jgi:hypothetical protein
LRRCVLQALQFRMGDTVMYACSQCGLTGSSLQKCGRCKLTRCVPDSQPGWTSTHRSMAPARTSLFPLPDIAHPLVSGNTGRSTKLSASQSRRPCRCQTARRCPLPCPVQLQVPLPGPQLRMQLPLMHIQVGAARLLDQLRRLVPHPCVRLVCHHPHQHLLHCREGRRHSLATTRCPLHFAAEPTTWVDIY